MADETTLQLAVRSTDQLIAMEEYEAAARILENYLSVYPPDAGLLSRLGRIRLQQSRAAEAAELFQQALKAQSPSPAVREHAAEAVNVDGQSRPPPRDRAGPAGTV
jgi:tetratricopeptide (TPR) repeat protein